MTPGSERRSRSGAGLDEEGPFLLEALGPPEEPLLEGEVPGELAGLSPSEQKAVRITSTFETGRPGGFGGLTGNFDGQGLSFGLMNWTVKAGSLIPLLQRFIREEPGRFGRIFGADAAAFQAMVFATRPDPKTGRPVRGVDAQMAFVRTRMNDAAQRNIVEPWRTYFKGLEDDAAFRRIEVDAARQGLRHARRWFERLKFGTERGFVFLFDLVSSHGPWWLDAPAFQGRREKLLAERLAAKRAALGRAPAEREVMEVIANLIADLSLPQWREQVRVRKLWFVTGRGKVHGSFYDLARDFGVTDAPPDLTPVAPAPPTGPPAPPPPPRGATTAGAPFSPAALLGALLERFRSLVQAGQEALAVGEAWRRGVREPDALTDLVFYTRHPERNGRRIAAGEPALAQEWTRIRDALVRPAVAGLARGAGTVRPSPAPAPPRPTSAPAGGTVLGLDTASVGGNKDPDWNRAAADAGIRFGIIRAAWGTYPDPTFARDWPRIRAAGMVRGPYLFLRFYHPKYGQAPAPAAQADALWAKVGPLERSDLPPTLDVEFPGGRIVTRQSAERCLEAVREAWKVLKARYGVAPIIYTSARVWHEDLLDLAAPDLTESPLWLARYPYRKGPAVLDPRLFAGGRNAPPVPRPWGDADDWWIHQYQGDAVRLPGFPTGNVDLNRFNPLQPGAQGDRVRWVQRRLGIAQTGTFDDATARALRGFREREGLGSEPAVDVRTFAFLCWANP